MTASAVDPVLCDTTILFYAFDADELEKRTVAVKLVADLIASRRLVFTAQLLNEFVWNVTRISPKRKTPRLDLKTTGAVVMQWCDVVDVLPLTKELTLRAIDAMPRHGLSFWDALVWASAKQHGVPLIYTEDFQHGRELEGVRFENPFLPPTLP